MEGGRTKQKILRNIAGWLEEHNDLDLACSSGVPVDNRNRQSVLILIDGLKHRVGSIRGLVIPVKTGSPSRTIWRRCFET